MSFISVSSFQLAEFDFHRQDTSHWLTDVQHRVDSLNSQMSAEVRLSSAQVSQKDQLQKTMSFQFFGC